MSEIITSSNIDLVVKKNKEIAEEVSVQAMRRQMNTSVIKWTTGPQLAFLILQKFGLIQMPIEDNYWSGAIYVKEGKIIPVINTAIPRANQYFAAWHEVYHLLFDEVSFDHLIENDNTIEERKAEYFAACMLLPQVNEYFMELPSMDIVSKVLCCMSMFQAPYKAVLISLYEEASRNGNNVLMGQIKEVLDFKIDDISNRFKDLGLDDSLVRPSFVVNTSYLQERIKNSELSNPELKYHEDNEEFLKNIVKEIQMITRNE